MASLLFDKCCCCIELRTGVLILGYLSLAGEIIFGLITLMAIIGGGAASASSDEQTRDAGHALLIVSAVLLVILVASLAATIVLLVGTHKNKRGHIKVYLICATIILILFLISTLASIGKTEVANTVSNLISVAINVYFLLVIRSFYYKMNDNAGKPTMYTTA